MSEKRKEKKCKPKKVMTAKLPHLVDVCVDDDGKPVFVVKNGDELEVKSSIGGEGCALVPPPFRAMPWALPRASKVIEHYNDTDDAKKLFDDIENAIRDNSELPDEKLYPFLAAWTLHTHLIDHFNYSPVIIFFAVAAKGKTRTGRTLLAMARRGIHVETIREADLIRKSERFTTAFFFDVMDIWRKAERLGSEDVLLGRFDKGIKIARVTNFDRQGFDDTQHFSCFGPTLVATNEPVNKYLDSRGIVINMREATRNFSNDPRERDFIDLRERATALRAHWLDRELPDVEKPSRNRLGDITKPILQVIETFVPERVTEFHALIRQFERDAANSLAETNEGKVIAALLELEDEVVQGVIITKILVEKINEDRPERYQTTSVSAGKRMSSLGFKSTTVRGQRGFMYDRDLIARLKEQYGLADWEKNTADNADESVDKDSKKLTEAERELAADLELDEA